MNRKLLMKVVPLEDWPQSDRLAWERIISRGHILSRGDFAHSSPLRIRLLRSSYGRWLGYLFSTFPESHIPSGRYYVHAPLLSSYISDLLDSVSSSTARSYVIGLQATIRAMDPHQDLTLLSQSARSLRWSALSERQKERVCILTTDLVRVGFEIMSSSKNDAGSSTEEIRFRDGLAISFLALRPIRHGNFSRIDVDRNISVRGGTIWFYIPGEEVRGGRTIEFPLPTVLKEPFLHYIEKVRPSLLCRRLDRDGPESSRLWLGRYGAPITPEWLRACIQRATNKALGVAVSPNMFRNSAARSIALFSPEHCGIIVSLLGYSSQRSAERFTVEAETFKAVRDYQDIISRFSNMY